MNFDRDDILFYSILLGGMSLVVIAIIWELYNPPKDYNKPDQQKQQHLESPGTTIITTKKLNSTTTVTNILQY